MLICIIKVYSVSLNSLNFILISINYALNAPAIGTNFPLSIGARNVVGDTTGTAVPAGYVGEISNSITANGVSVGTSSYTTSSGLTLSAGVWHVFLQINTSGNASVVGVEMGISTDSVSTTFSDRDLTSNLAKVGVGAGFGCGGQLWVRFVSSGSTTVYGKFIAAGATETVYYRLRAIRIA